MRSGRAGLVGLCGAWLTSRHFAAVEPAGAHGDSQPSVGDGAARVVVAEAVRRRHVVDVAFLVELRPLGERRLHAVARLVLGGAGERIDEGALQPRPKVFGRVDAIERLRGRVVDVVVEVGAVGGGAAAVILAAALAVVGRRVSTVRA